LDNPETGATCGTQDTRRRTKQNTTQEAKKMNIKHRIKIRGGGGGTKKLVKG